LHPNLNQQKSKTKNLLFLPSLLFDYNTIYSNWFKIFWDKDFWSVFWRYKWQNQGVDAKWAAKKDVPAGKYDTKRADNQQPNTIN
jgi:hypothetical protein